MCDPNTHMAYIYFADDEAKNWVRKEASKFGRLAGKNEGREGYCLWISPCWDYEEVKAWLRDYPK